MGASLIPGFREIELDPELALYVLLPPLHGLDLEEATLNRA